MKTFFRVVLLIIIICASVLSLFVLMPFAKEGSSWGDMPLFAGTVGAALGLGLIWWLAVGRSVPRRGSRGGYFSDAVIGTESAVAGRRARTSA